jgi:hypothetical protein
MELSRLALQLKHQLLRQLKVIYFLIKIFLMLFFVNLTYNLTLAQTQLKPLRLPKLQLKHQLLRQLKVIFI